MFSVISDILIINMHSPLPPYQAVMDLVMTFKVTSNNIERGRGVRNVSQFSICFQECIFRWKSIFLGECLNNFATTCSSQQVLLLLSG